MASNVYFICDGEIQFATPANLGRYCRDFANGVEPAIGDVAESVGPAVDLSNLTAAEALDYAIRLERGGSLEPLGREE
jgi:hypothetical protein